MWEATWTCQGKQKVSQRFKLNKSIETCRVQGKFQTNFKWMLTHKKVPRWCCGFKFLSRQAQEHTITSKQPLAKTSEGVIKWKLKITFPSRLTWKFFKRKFKSQHHCSFQTYMLFDQKHVSAKKIEGNGVNMCFLKLNRWFGLTSLNPSMSVDKLWNFTSSAWNMYACIKYILVFTMLQWNVWSKKVVPQSCRF